MVAKAILLVCAQALMIQHITGQCFGSSLAASQFAAAPFAGNFAAGPRAFGPYSAAAGNCAGATPFAGSYDAGFYGAGGYGPAAAAASNGGALPTSSASPVPPSGVSLVSKNEYEGPLAVSGALPFLGTVALGGILPTAGAGAVAFGAGNGEVAMLSEDIGAAGMAGPYGADAFGYRSGAFGYGMGASSYAERAAYDASARAGCGCGTRF